MHPSVHASLHPHCCTQLNLSHPEAWFPAGEFCEEGVYSKSKFTFEYNSLHPWAQLFSVTERRKSHLFGDSDPDLSALFNSVLHLKGPRARHFVEVMSACPCSVTPARGWWWWKKNKRCDGRWGMRRWCEEEKEWTQMLWVRVSGAWESWCINRS